MERFSTWKKIAAFYGVALILWLAFCAARLAIDRSYETVVLDAAAAEAVGLEPQGGNVWVSVTDDPQFVFENLGHKIRAVEVEMRFAKHPGEMALYYAKEPGQGFSAQKRAIGVPGDPESYRYTLAPGRYEVLRIDPGMQADNTIEVLSITLNPQRPAGWYFTPSLREGLALALLPALAYCAFSTIIEGVNRLSNARKKPEQTGEKDGTNA